MGMIFFCSRCTCATQNEYFDGIGFAALADFIIKYMKTALGSQRCLTNDIQMILEPGSQEIRLLHEMNIFAKSALFEEKSTFLLKSRNSALNCIICENRIRKY